MSVTTNISWADHTASPWFGCSRVSPGCENCYAEKLTLQKKWAGWGPNSPRVRSKGFWNDVYRWDRKAKKQVDDWNLFRNCVDTSDKDLAENGFIAPKRPRLFTSLMDWLDPQAPVEWLAIFMKVVHDCQHLDFLLLTKRPELFLERTRLATAYARGRKEIGDDERDAFWCPDNAWIGVTVEDQKRADERITILKSIPARVRWLSVEPLLEKVSLDLTKAQPIHDPEYGDQHEYYEKRVIDWVVIGGESGPGRRDCGVDAIVNVAQQCVDAAVPVWVKQDVGARPGQQGRIPNDIWNLKQLPKAV